MTSPLSGVRSSQLSYRPEARYCTTSIYLKKCVAKEIRLAVFLRKEVIQPLVPQRLPCYDFTPITGHTFEGCLLAVSSPTSGTTGFRGVTGGVYKARERIHRGIADPRLLAIPRSRSRVADSDPN
jgi:hypothetical protein